MAGRILVERAGEEGREGSRSDKSEGEKNWNGKHFHATGHWLSLPLPWYGA